MKGRIIYNEPLEPLDFRKLAKGYPLDIVLIERAAVNEYEENKWEMLNPDSDTRIIRFWPLTWRDYDHPFMKRTTREQAEHRYNQAKKKSDATCSMEEFLNDPKFRLVDGEVDQERNVLFYDNPIFGGITLCSCFDDFIKMGYKKDMMFYIDTHPLLVYPAHRLDNTVI